MSSTQELGFAPVWTAAGIVVGFSVTAFIFRIKRESDIRSGLVPGETEYWLPPADFVLLLSLAVALIGVFVVPVLGAGLGFARHALGWSLLLLAGYPFALAGHYEILFGRIPQKTLDKWAKQLKEKGDKARYPWRTRQETGIIVLLVAASVVYFVCVAA